MPLPCRLDFPQLRRLACWFALSALPLFAAEAEWRTLTDSQGRAIRAQIVSATDNEVTIKREDGQTFTLPLAQLSEKDQKDLRAYAKANPPAIPAGALELQLSRGKFDTLVSKETITLVGGKIVKDGLVITTEKWGYTVSLKNRTDHELSGVRLDYVLFARQDQAGNPKSSDQKFRQKRYRTNVEPIAVFSQTDVRTNTIDTRKTQLQGGIVWKDSGGDSTTRDTLYGIWLRVYVGDQLLIEQANPPGLATSEKWPDGLPGPLGK